MKPARSLTVALVMLFLAALPGAHADEPAAQRTSSWWSLWSWIDDLFGASFGGVSYGSGESGRVIGSDQLVHQGRVIADVHRIELRGPIGLVIKQGGVEQLTLHTDDNIVGLIQTTVNDGVLRIGVRPGASFRTRHAIGATVQLTSLSAITVVGPGEVTCDGLDAESLDVTASGPGEVRIDTLHSAAITVLLQGSGAVRLSGNSARQSFVIDGSGELDAAELVGRAVAVRVNGSGTAKLWATQSLSVDIRGSGNVRYRGQPTLTSSLQGSGRLIHD